MPIEIKPIPTQPLVGETLKVQTAPSDQSPGYKTTEFWLHLLVIVGIIATGLVGVGLPKQWEAVCLVISAASYSISRGLAKMGNSN